MEEIVTADGSIREEEARLNVMEMDYIDPGYDETLEFDELCEILYPGIYETPGSRVGRDEGRLLAERLPSDAWEKWCKEGVVCFYMGGKELQKVYFANPRNLSVYHVVDFVYWKYERFPRLHSVGCVLLGSKIYMIGGLGIYKDGDLESGDPTDVYYCDVATQAQLPEGGYEWKSAPALNSSKRTPYVFSLAGNIYVLSVDNPHQPFEVLKSGSPRWDVLTSPPPSLWTGDPHDRIRVRGSHTIADKKIFLQAQRANGTMGWQMGTGGSSLFVYDAEDDNWTIMKFEEWSPVVALPRISYYCLHQFPFPGIDFQFLTSEVFGSKFRPPYMLNILHLGGDRFCIIALYTDYGLDDLEPAPSSSAQVATLDLNAADNVLAHSDGKLRENFTTHSYSVSNPKTKEILLNDDASLLPYEFCSKTLIHI